MTQWRIKTLRAMKQVEKVLCKCDEICPVCPLCPVCLCNLSLTGDQFYSLRYSLFKRQLFFYFSIYLNSTALYKNNYHEEKPHHYTNVAKTVAHQELKKNPTTFLN